MRIYQEKNELEDKVHHLEQVQQTRDELGVANLDNEIISNHPGKRRRSPQDVQGSLDVQRSNPSPDDDSDLMLSRYGTYLVHNAYSNERSMISQALHNPFNILPKSACPVVVPGS
jgi:uncharacterized protein YdcH (DUF465 family)